MNVTMLTWVWGTYGEYLTRWCDAVERMDPQPTRIIVNHGSEIAPRIKAFSHLNIEWREDNSEHYPTMIASQLADIHDGWIFQLAVDDYTMPDALTALNGIPEDVDIVLTSRGYVGSTAVQECSLESINRFEFLFNPASFFTARIWHAMGGAWPDIWWNDHAFLVKAYASGARFMERKQVTTMFNADNPLAYSRNTPSWADQQLRDWRTQHGLGN